VFFYTYSQRSGHSMVFDPASRTLFIFGGRLGASESHSDVWVYDVDSHAVSRAVEHIAAAGGPTTDVQRAVIDPALGEIYLCARPHSSAGCLPDGTTAA
jgi:hypothetical protein